MGIAGLAWATMIPAWLVYFGWQSVTVCRCVGLPLAQLVKAQLTSLAPTLAAILGTKPPTAATGQVLEEALPR